MLMLAPFLEKFGPGHDCEEYGASDPADKRGALPPAVTELWQSEGICGYRNGILSFLDPDKNTDLLEEWHIGDYSVFGRNGFGDLLLWSVEGISVLSVQLGAVHHLAKNVEIFLNKVLALSSVRNDILHEDVHEAAVARLGRPAPDEMFAYVPALALGGPGTIETVERVKFREHLSILAQIHGRSESE